MKRSLQVIALIISILRSVYGLNAQELLVFQDSLLLHEVQIQAEVQSQPNTEHGKLDIVHGLMSGDLGQYLDRMGRAQVLSNGSTGAASAVRNRGLSSDHTVLYWNDVPINSFSLGTCDLSMIPVFFFDDVSQDQSTTLSSHAYSNLGSSIRFAGSRKMAPTFSARILNSVNTLRNTFTGIDIAYPFGEQQEVRSSQLYLRTRIFYQDIRNEFKYKDDFQFEHPVLLQTHNDGINRGVQQELRCLFGRSEFSSAVWYQSKRIQIPSLMGSVGSGTSEQSDDVFRSQCVYRFFGSKSRLTTSIACMDENMHYRDKNLEPGKWMIDSKIKSQVLFVDTKGELQLGKYFVFQQGITVLAPKIGNTNYESGAQRDVWTQFNTALKWNHKSHTLNAETRHDTRERSFVPNYALNYRYYLTLKKISVDAGMTWAEQLRFPDFNELYWVPGGNPELLPERGQLLEWCLNTQWNFSENLHLNVGGKLFYRNVEDWIQWIPTEHGFWSPVNYKTVKTFGYDLPVVLDHQKDKTRYTLELKYSHLDALFVNQDVWNDAEAKHLTYTPEHTIHAGLQIMRGVGYFLFSYNYVDSRYSDEMNTSYRELPSYQLCYAEVGTTVMRKKIIFKPSISIDNVFDVAYQSLRSYAMPGRVFQMNLQISYQR